MRSRIVNARDLVGSPSSTATFAPAGSIAGAGPHVIWSGRAIVTGRCVCDAPRFLACAEAAVRGTTRASVSKAYLIMGSSLETGCAGTSTGALRDVSRRRAVANAVLLPPATSHARRLTALVREHTAGVPRCYSHQRLHSGVSIAGASYRSRESGALRFSP